MYGRTERTKETAILHSGMWSVKSFLCWQLGCFQCFQLWLMRWRGPEHSQLNIAALHLLTSSIIWFSFMQKCFCLVLVDVWIKKSLNMDLLQISSFQRWYWYNTNCVFALFAYHFAFGTSDYYRLWTDHFNKRVTMHFFFNSHTH